MSHDTPQSNPYRKVSIATWSDARVTNLSPLQPSGQALFLMLLVGPQTTNIPGVQPIGRMAFAEALGWEPEAFDEAFAEAYRQGLAKADWKARLIFVPKAIKHNLPQSPNVVKSWALMWSRVPQCDLKTEVWHALVQALSTLGDSYVSAFKSACPLGFSEDGDPGAGDEIASGKTTDKATGKPTDKPSPKPTGNQEAVSSKQETVIDTPLPPKGGKRRRSATKPLTQSMVDAFEGFYAAYPRKIGRKAALQAWQKLSPDDELCAKILSALRAQVPKMDLREGGRFVMYPARWINGEHWDDGKDGKQPAAGTSGEPVWWQIAGFDHPAEAQNAECHIGNYREFANGQRRQAELGVTA